VSRLEERLRDAYQAGADTVTREMDAPDLAGAARLAGRVRPGHATPAMRVAAPLAAAAAVAAIALAVSLIAASGPGAKAHHPSGPARLGLAPATGVAQGYQGDRFPAAALPAYFVGIQTTPHGPTEYAFTAYVYSAATGRRTGRLTLPGHGLWVQAVASLGNGSYVAAATRDWPRFGCRSWLYQFRLTAAGRPAGLKPFVVPQLPGWARQLAGSGDGRAAVLIAATCGHGKTQFMGSDDDRATEISVPSGATTSWSPWPAASKLTPENVVQSATLADGGRLLPFVAIPGGQPAVLVDTQAAYVMYSGPAGRGYRLVVNPAGSAGAVADAPSPTGRVTYVLTARRHGGRWHETIAAYSTATGRMITVLASASARFVDADGYLMPDASGRYLLLLGFGGDNTAVLDVATHHLTVVPVRYPYPPLGAAW